MFMKKHTFYFSKYPLSSNQKNSKMMGGFNRPPKKTHLTIIDRNRIISLSFKIEKMI